MTGTPLTLKRWRRDEYERLVEIGAFAGEALELIDGQLIVAEPQGAYHASAISAAEYAFRAALPSGWIVRTQMPVSLDDLSEPEPDLVVVEGRPGGYRDAHPRRPAVVVEIAESSLEFDRDEKGGLYARAGIEDYWIVNLVDRVVEIYGEPTPDPSAPHGWRYRATSRLTPPTIAAPLLLASCRIRVSDLLP